MTEFSYTKAQSAENLDWSKIQYFKKEEFRSEDLPLLNRYVIEQLNIVRSFLGVPIHISPADGAVIRQNETNKNSYHYANLEDNRLGQAIDCFLDTLIPFVCPIQILTTILGAAKFRGVGFYFDTFYKDSRRLMIHLDLRHQPLFFFAKKDKDTNQRKYFYSKYENDFLSILKQEWDSLKLETMLDDEICIKKTPLPECHEIV